METMSEPLTDLEIAELRELYGSLPERRDVPVWEFYDAARDAVPVLLDEVVEQRKLATEIGDLLMYLLTIENLSPPARRRVERMINTVRK
jgi:hypothetical protein